jgi:hypothetical protein
MMLQGFWEIQVATVRARPVGPDGCRCSVTAENKDNAMMMSAELEGPGLGPGGRGGAPDITVEADARPRTRNCFGSVNRTVARQASVNKAF